MQNKVLEAMALGKPIVASTLATEAIAGKHSVHFFVADSVHETVEAVTNLFSDSSLRKELGKNAMELVREKYSWDVVRHSLLDLVQETLAIS